MSLLRNFATVGSATLLSRVLGFAREVLIAATLGTGPVADAFYAAFRFPNLFRRLFAEGAFNSAFVPLFAKQVESGGRVAARQFAGEIFSILLIVLLAVTGIAELAMPWLVSWVIAPGFDPGSDKHDLTILLTRIVFPYLACMSLVAMLSGILNSFGKFAIAALAPVLLNIIMVAVLAGAQVMGTGNTALTGQLMAWGVAGAGVAQLALLWFAVRAADFTFIVRWPTVTPQVKRLLVLAVPAAIAGGVTQINLLIGQMIASLQAGAISILQYADRIYQLPLGVVGIAVGVVLLPELSRALRAGDGARAIQAENQSLLFAMLLVLPAAAALVVIAEPVVGVLFERGAFSAADTAATTPALMAFAAGLPAFVLIKIFSPGYFAREDTRTPMLFATASMVINVTGSLTLFPIYGPVGIAIATSVAGWVNALALYVTLVRRGHWSWLPGTARRIAIMVLASAIMAALLGAADIWSAQWAQISILAQIGKLVALIVLGAAVYFIVVHLLKGYDLRSARRSMRGGGSDM
jgi:putative peptidoglycan lipid II flippase